MNRRRFLANSAGLSVALTARSYGQALGANDNVQIGVIGLGRRGTILTHALLRDPRARIVAVSDIYDAQAEQYLARLPASQARAATYLSYQELLARPEVDAVIIAAPDHLHLTIGKAALEAGKHVYLEKPTLHRWQERAELTQAAMQSGRVLQCGTQQRSGAHYLRAKEEIFESGKLGEVIFARAVWHNFPWQQRHITNEPKPAGLDWDGFLGPAPHVPYETVRYSSWRYFPEYGGGLLADILTHWVDVAQWMLDDTESQSATAFGGIYDRTDEHDGRINPDTVSAIVQYRKWNLNFESSVLPIRNDRPSVYFEGTEGTLDLAREGYVFTPNKGTAVKVDSIEELEIAHTRNFLDAINKHAQVNAPLQAGIDASRPVQMALQSYWKKRQVSVSDLA